MGASQVASAGESGSISGSGKSPGEGNGTALQYSCLGNPMDRGAWRATVHGVAKSRTPLSTHTDQSSECTHIHWGKAAHRNILRRIGSNVIFSILWKEVQKKLTEETCSRSQNPARAETRHEFRSPIQFSHFPHLPTMSPWLYPWGGRAFVFTHFPCFCFRSLLLLLLNVFLLKYNCCTQSLLFLIKILQYSNPYLDPIILSPSPEITTLLNSEFVIST